MRKFGNMPHILWDKYKGQSPFKTYAGFYSKYKWRLLFAIFMYFVKASPAYVIPIITADIINLLTAGDGTAVAPRIYKLMVIGLVLIIQNVPTHTFYIHLFSTVNRQVEMDLRAALCARLQHLSMQYHASRKLGVLQAKVLRDVEAIEGMTRLFVDSLPHLLATLLIAITVTLIRAPMFVLFYVALVPVAVLIYRLVKEKLRERNYHFRRNMEEMGGHVNEMLRLIPVTRAHHLEQEEMNRVKERLEQLRRSGLSLDNMTAIFGSISWTVTMSFNLLALCAASLLYTYKMLNIGIGDIVLLSSYFGQISGAIMGLLGFIPAVTKGLESVKSIGEVLECPDIEQNEDKKVLGKVGGNFVFDNVTFGYANSETPALRDFSLQVKSGETIALVGASGAGKSTLAQLVIGFIRPTSGKIYLDGTDMNDIDLRTYRQFISVVTQETILFDGTIKDNIAYGIHDASEKKIQKAVKAANLEDLVLELPDGLDTRIFENGARLSGGQRQRIAIARALLRDPKVLILDEATSALDVDSEAEIKAALEYLVKGRTTFVVAHRLSTIQNADRIVVLDGGRIMEIGSHKELLASGGRYSRMYEKFINQK